MSRIKDVRGIMAAALTAAGLKTTTRIPAVIHPPCGLLRPDSGNWDTTLPRTVPMDNYILTVLLSGAQLDPETAQDNLDEFLETTGKLKAAVEGANYTGKISYARVKGWRDYGTIVTLGTTDYVSVVLDIVTYGL
jgi:hypothetical protein